MNVSQLTMRDLEYLVTVASTLHFGKAAQELGVSQPTLSEQVKKLELHLCVKIFERTNRSVRLTDEGKLYIESAKKMLEEAKVFVGLNKQKQAPLTGEFRLGAIATVGPYYFPYVLPSILKAHSKLDLIIQEGMTDDLLKDLDNGVLDAVIASRTFDEKKYRVYPLYFEPFCLGLPIGNHEVRLKAGKASIKDLDVTKLVLLTEGNCLKDEVLNFCTLERRHKDQKIQASGLETLRQLVASGRGPSLFPQLAVSDYRKLRALIQYYPFVEKNVGRSIALVARETYPHPDSIRFLHKTLIGFNHLLPLTSK